MCMTLDTHIFSQKNLIDQVRVLLNKQRVIFNTNLILLTRTYLSTRTNEPMSLTKTTLSVSELNKRARMLLETRLNQVWVEGELSNFTRPSSGHWYFSLKDHNAQIRCAMFRNRNLLVKNPPKQGDKVRLRGRVSLYEPRGDYQLIAEHMEASGEGLLQKQFEELKKKLQAEGLFDALLKQPIPTHVAHVAVISSSSGAAVHDVLNVLKRRNRSIMVTIVPTSVQGAEAPMQLTHAIELAQRLPTPADVIIIGRGGGSLEDLAAFNDESLARALFQCPIPTVSAVGHETDVSISDFVADVRAPTPSAAAELVSGDTEEIKQWTRTLYARAVQAVTRTIEKQKLRSHTYRKRLKHPGEKIRHWQQRTDICEQRLLKSMRQHIKVARQHLLHTDQKLNTQHLNRELANKRHHLKQLNTRLSLAIKHIHASKQNACAQMAASLDLVSPLATLKRGYSITRNAQGEVVRSVRHVEAGKQITIQLADGEIKADTIEVTT